MIYGKYFKYKIIPVIDKLHKKIINLSNYIYKKLYIVEKLSMVSSSNKKWQQLF